MIKIVNVYIVYDLDSWPKNLTNNLKFRNYLFGATSAVKNSDKENCVYSGYGITFDSTVFWIFDNNMSRNVKLFGVNNSSSSDAGPRSNFQN